jgi:quinol monooxygenase YgiN
MAVKVLLTRKFKQDKFDEAYHLLMELRSLATLRRGYMSGETLISATEPNKILVISTWVSRKRWDEWQADPKRKEFTQKLTPLLESPEEVDVYLVGEKIPEWVDMA